MYGIVDLSEKHNHMFAMFRCKYDFGIFDVYHLNAIILKKQIVLD